MARPSRRTGGELVAIDAAGKAQFIHRFQTISERLKLSNGYLALKSDELERECRSNGLSEKTLHRIRRLTPADIESIRSGSPVRGTPDRLTTSKLARLVSRIEAESHDSQPLQANLYAALASAMRIDIPAQSRWLSLCAGHYKCYRLSSMSRELLITRLTIYCRDGVPHFRHVERTPSTGPTAGQWRELTHEGHVFFSARRWTFLSTEDGYVRQLVALPSPIETRPACSGLLSSINLPHGIPFAARIYMERFAQLQEPVMAIDDFGLFDVADPRFSRVVAYVHNGTGPHEALLANDSI